MCAEKSNFQHFTLSTIRVYFEMSNESLINRDLKRREEYENLSQIIHAAMLVVHILYCPLLSNDLLMWGSIMLFERKDSLCYR